MNKSIHEYYTASIHHLQEEKKILDKLLNLAVFKFQVKNLEAEEQSERMRAYMSTENNDEVFDGDAIEALWNGDDLEKNSIAKKCTALLSKIQALEQTLEKKAAQSKQQGINLCLIAIADMFHLSKSEVFILLICYAHHHSKKYRNIFQYLTNTKKAPFPSIAVLHSLVSSRYGEHTSFHDCFSVAAPLIHNGLIEFVNESNGAHTPFWLRQVTISETAYRYLQNESTASDALEALRDYPNRNLAKLATKIRHSFTFDDIILPKDTKNQLMEIVSFYRQQYRILYELNFAAKLPYGRGLSVLFSGQSGTGKTMAAGIIANELSLDAYRIDLSTIVSKYIGETEKNLSAVFAEAKNSNAILVFDEADALFGKRSEVKDAHDRYANVEISYLLQKMEEYEGMTILTTNLRNNIDEAFTRRLKFIVEFPFPNEAQREAIWRISFPKEASLDTSVDCAFLAKKFTEHAGGDIQLMALMSAMFAGRRGEPIGMKHILLAVRRMFQRKGRTIREFDYKPYYDLIKDEIG